MNKIEQYGNVPVHLPVPLLLAEQCTPHQIIQGNQPSRRDQTGGAYAEGWQLLELGFQEPDPNEAQRYVAAAERTFVDIKAAGHSLPESGKLMLAAMPLAYERAAGVEFTEQARQQTYINLGELILSASEGVTHNPLYNRAVLTAISLRQPPSAIFLWSVSPREYANEMSDPTGHTQYVVRRYNKAPFLVFSRCASMNRLPGLGSDTSIGRLYTQRLIRKEALGLPWLVPESEALGATRENDYKLQPAYRDLVAQTAARLLIAEANGHAIEQHESQFLTLLSNSLNRRIATDRSRYKPRHQPRVHRPSQNIYDPDYWDL